MKIRPPVKEYDPIAIARDIGDFWARTFAYRRSKNLRANMKKYFFVDGPPFTTGKCHLDLARNKILKDSHIRFTAAQGFNVIDTPGFDMQGLPVEVKVEAAHGITYKNQIEEMGVENFVKDCMSYAKEHLETMVGQFRELGIWMDWDSPYLTSDNAYIESVWWTVKEAHRRRCLERQKRVTPWCPRCESPLTKGEIRYIEKEGHSAYLKIPIKGRRDEYIIVWTTTPWTFAGALAIAVNPNYTYARVAVRQAGRKSTIIVLESQVEKIAKVADIEAYEILESVKGSQLKGLGFFHPLMADIQFHKTAKGENCHKILCIDSVYGGKTGSVYISPGFGSADSRVAEEYGLPIFSPIDERGIFTTEVGMKYAGKTVEEASRSILSDMNALRFVLKDARKQHKFGHCWRCGSPIINRVTEQWFIKIDDFGEMLQRSVRGISWVPEELGRDAQNELIQKANDWCISRQRYWGTPLPVWQCIMDVCAHTEVIGSLKELEGANGYRPGMDLHKPWIDSITLECPKCGGLMKRVPDIIDVWFDSSIASWGQLGYPRKKQAFKELWPADFVCESHEQIKGWFFNQAFSGVMAFQKIPFRKALVHGSILDETGRSMQISDSQHSEAGYASGIYGPDALRLYMLGLEPGKTVRFDSNRVRKAHRDLRILWNCYVFCATYMSMDGWNPADHPYQKVKGNLHPEDVWMLSRLETVNHEIKREMENSRPDRAVELLRSFILDDLSRCYVKFVRERVWKEGSTPDKDAVLFTLREALVRLSIFASPFIPHISEHIYRELDGSELTVSMVAWPEINATRLSDNAEKCMNHARNIVRMSHRLRQQLGLNQRWPVKKLTVSASNENVTNAVKMFDGFIKHQTNVRELEIVPENQEWEGQELIVIPNPDIIGKAYKQRESKIARMLKVLPAKDIKAKIEQGEYSLGIEGELIRILPDMVKFVTKLPDGVISTEFEDGVIYLDSNTDEETIAEGYAREIVRRIQQMRSDMKLDPEEFISVKVKMGEDLIETLDAQFEKIADSARASQLEIVEDVGDMGYIVEWPVIDETVLIGITSLDVRKAMNVFLAVRDVDSELALSIVDSGICSAEDFLGAEREELLRIPGMSHSKLRKIKEYLEAPADNRPGDEQSCSLCGGFVGQGETFCQRCGKSLIGDEELYVEPRYNIYEGEEDEYYEEAGPRQKVRRERKKQAAEEQPEDEIIKMATDTSPKVPKPEDAITSEIMGEITVEREKEKKALPNRDAYIPAVPENDAYVPAQPQTIPEKPVKSDYTEDLAGEIAKEASAEKLPVPAIIEKTPAEESAPQEILAPAPSEVEDLTPEIITDTPAETAISDSRTGSEPQQTAPEDNAKEAENDNGYDKESKSEIIGNETDLAISHIAETFDIKHSAAKVLFSSGYTTPEALYNIREEELREIKGIGKITARRVVQKLSSHKTKMCSLCNAIVSANSPVCTRCGVAFVLPKDDSEPVSTEKSLEHIDNMERSLSGGTSDAALLLSKAMTLKDAGKLDEALATVNDALEIAPGDDALIKTKRFLESAIGPASQPEPPQTGIITAGAPETASPPAPREPEPEPPQDAKSIESLVSGLNTAEKEAEHVKLKRSFTYLIPEERSALSYKLFKECIESGMPGYCVTRTFPEKVRERYELGQIPILWLSNVAKEDSVRPKDLEKLSLSLEEFLGKEGGGIILLDGIEYLITNNNFITVLKLIQSLRDQVAINRSIMLLSINPSTMDSHQINLLRREVDSVLE